MNVIDVLHVHARNLPLEHEDRTTLERRVLSALDRFADRVRRVDLSLVDVNGPRGGVDVRCHAHVALRDGMSVDVEARGESPLAAITIALGRLRRSVARRRRPRR